MDDHAKHAIATYTGPVTICPPGRARGRRIKPKNEAVAWLKRQPGGGWPKEKPEVKRQRFKAQRAAIAAHNEAVRKAHGLRKREVG